MSTKVGSQNLVGSQHGLDLRMLKVEIQKMLRIFFRGPQKGIVAMVLIFPITFTLFMWLVFGRTYFAYPTAIVVTGYDSQSSLDHDLTADLLPEIELFINYVNNYSLVEETIVHSEVSVISYSEEEVQQKLENLEILVILILPDNFEDYIAQARLGAVPNETLEIRCKCANINEDLLKNLYFGIQRKLSAYYQLEFPEEIEVNYEYSNVDPNKVTFPRMWTIGSGGIVFSILAASFIIGSAMVFTEKKTHMDAELTMISSNTRGMNYLGKVLATALISTAINFPFSAILILNFLQMGFPVHLLSLIGVIFLANLLGAACGIIMGVLIPEQVFTFPVNVFIVLPMVFLCGGFMDIQLFGEPLYSIVLLVPFTYIFSLVKISILPGFIWNWGFFGGLLIYLLVFLVMGWRIYNRGMIKGWQH